MCKDATWNALCSRYRALDTKRTKSGHSEHILQMSLPQLPLVEATVLQPMCAPPEINVSVDSLISRTDSDILRERNLPLLLPPEVEL